VLLLLAARDAQLEDEEEKAALAVAEAAEAAEVAAAAATTVAAVATAVAQQATAERPSCTICMEADSAAGGVVAAFCEACLARLLRCAGTNGASPWMCTHIIHH
jgi:ABC-type phosphate transport system substrate-binding protein